MQDRHCSHIYVLVLSFLELGTSFDPAVRHPPVPIVLNFGRTGQPLHLKPSSLVNGMCLQGLRSAALMGFVLHFVGPFPHTAKGGATGSGNRSAGGDSLRKVKIIFEQMPRKFMR